MDARRILYVALAVSGGLLLAYCGEKTEPTGGQDAGAADVASGLECLSNDDCFYGDCIGGECIKCINRPCGAGMSCGALFKCQPCEGGNCASAADAGSGTACATRQDCPAGQICSGGAGPDAGAVGRCKPPDPTGSCLTPDECPVGSVCNTNAGVNLCMVGCFSNADCRGVVLDGGQPAPHCDTIVNNKCGPCIDGNDCGLGENCVDGVCQKAPECIPPDRTPCGAERACVATDGGFVCGPCTAERVAEECGQDYDCVAGRCIPKNTGCTSDLQCKRISDGHYCDRTTGQCEWGCLVPTDGGSCGVNCCPGNDECNPFTHQCGSSTCEDCNPACTFGQVCDTSTCTCRDESEMDGGVVDIPCNDRDCTGCPTGMKCMCMGMDILPCTTWLGGCAGIYTAVCR